MVALEEKSLATPGIRTCVRTAPGFSVTLYQLSYSLPLLIISYNTKTTLLLNNKINLVHMEQLQMGRQMENQTTKKQTSLQH